jgi:hypothetical protein
MYLSTIEILKGGNIMPNNKKPKETKCIVVHLPIDLIKRLDDFKEKSGESKNSILIQFIRNGLNQQR